jgi:hypothetical protein
LDLAVHDQMRRADPAHDPGSLADDKDAVLGIVGGNHVTAHLAVNPEAF